MLTQEQITQIAKLAKLDISHNSTKIALDLDNILNIVNKLQNISTDNILPMAHPFDEKQRLRTDEISEINNRDLYQQNAPFFEKGHYLVPKVL